MEEEVAIEGSNVCDEFEWEDLSDILTEHMKQLGSADWAARVEGFGWRSLDGTKDFRAETGKELLCAVLPNTECTFTIYLGKKDIRINNSHHDKPTGGEWYYISPR